MANYPRASPARWWKTTAVGAAHRSPHSMFVGRFRRWTSVLVLLVLALVVGGVWFMVSPSRLSAMASILLSHVLGGDVTIATSHLSWDGTLQLTGVKLKIHGGTGAEATLFSADQFQVSFKWLGLLSGRLEATEIDADQPSLNLVQDMDSGHWNYETFLKNRKPGLPSGGGAISGALELPIINLRNAEVRWWRVENGRYEFQGTSKINGQLGPSELSASSYVMEIQQQTDNGAPGITLDGQWNVAQREFDAHISNLELTDQLRRTLPEPIQEWWQKLHLQGGIEQIGFHINSTDGIQLTAKLRDVSMILTVPSQKLGPQIVPISGLSGDVTAGNLNFRIINLSGTVMNSRFVVPAAEFDGYRSGDPFDVTVNMPGLNIDPHYPVLFSTEKFSVASALIYRMRPSGLVDLSVQVSRQKNKPVVVDGQILCRDVQARYVHFPYPFEHAQGLIRFNTHLIDFVNTHAVAETYPLTLNGTVGINTENSAVNLTIRADKCFFDQRLAECMPAELIPIWNKFNPVGFGSFICHVTRTQGDSGRPAITVQIFPTDVSGAYVDFPYPLQHVHGELYFTEHQTQIINLTAPVNGGKGSIIFNGTVDYSPDAVNDMQPHVHIVATNIPVDQNLWNSLPDSYNRHLKPLNLVSGTTGLDAMITRGPEDSPQVDGTLTLTGGTLKPILLPWLITNVVMQAHLSLRNVDILSLTGNLGQNQKGTFAISGHMYIPEVGATELDASGSWRNVQIGGAAPTSLPRQWQQVWDKWNPSGNLDGTLQLAMSMEESDTGQSTNTFKSLDVSLEPMNMQLSPVFLPDRVTGIHGIVDVTPKIIQLKNLDAASGPITLTLNGAYNLGNSSIDLSLVAQAPRIPSEWIKVLPGSAAPMVRALDPQAAWMLDLGKLEYSNEGGKPDWQLTGSVVLNDLKLQKTINASAEHTTVTIAGDWAAGEEVPDIAGEFLIENLTWAGKTVNPVSGQISADAIKKTIDVSPITGTIANGSVDGEVDITFAPQAAYSAAFAMKGVELADLLGSGTATAPDQPPTNSGTVNASLSMSQKFSDPATRSGSGRLEVTNAKIYNVPLAMGLLQIATLRLPISDAFNYALIKYSITGDTVTFNSIQLDSAGVDLAGTGTTDLSTRQLSLNMATQTPNGPNIPVLGDIVAFAQQQLLELRIRGTLDNPVVVPIPLHMVTWPLDWLVP